MRRREPLRRPLNLPRPLFSKRGLARFHSTSPGERGELLAELSAPSYPPGTRWDDPLDAGSGGGSLPDHGFRRRRGAGHLRDRIPARLRARSAAASPRRGARARDARSLAGPRPGLDGRRAQRRTRDARGRGRPRPVVLSGRRHARRDEVRRPPPPPQDRGMSYTLRGRIESRLAAALLPFLGRVRDRARARRLVAGRAGGGDDRYRARLRRGPLPPAPALPARVGRDPARTARADRDDGARPPLRHRRAARARPLVLRRCRGLSHRFSVTRAGRSCASPTPRTAGSSAGAGWAARPRADRPAPRPRNRLGDTTADRPPRGGRPSGTDRDHDAARSSTASQGRSSRAASSSAPTT